MEKELRVLRESKRTMELEFNRALQTREKEYQELESKLYQETEAKIVENKIQMSTNTNLTSLESKRLLRKKNEKNFSTEAYEDSKRKLSKMMSQLERKLIIEEKKNISMSNLIDQSKAEKESYKQKYTSLKKKIKQAEIQQMKINKMSAIENIQHGITPFADSNPQNTKLIDYKDLRKERKISINKTAESISNNPYVDNISNMLNPDSSGGKDKRATLLRMRHSTSAETTNSNVFDRLMSHSTITSKIKERRPVFRDEADLEDAINTNSKGGSLGMEVEESELLWN